MFINFQYYSRHFLQLTFKTHSLAQLKEFFFWQAACQFRKTSIAHWFLYWVLLGFERSSKETSSLQPLGGRNQKDLSVASSSISQNCKWGCQCKVWMLLLNKPSLWKKTTLFITLTKNYVYAIMKQNKSNTDYFVVSLLLCLMLIN